MKRILLITFMAITFFLSYGQKITRVGKSPIVCYASPENHPTKIAPPKSFNLSGAKIKSSTIEVVYNGFSPEAQAAFQFAVDIWESLISSPIPIRISANWTKLGNGVLGSAGPTFYASDFDGAPNININYPGALAEKLAGQQLNDPTEFDIAANFNSDFTWHYDPLTQPASGKYDLISVVLHELGHGLGFVDSYNFVSETGEYGSFSDGVPFVYDIHIENQGGSNLYQNFTSPSTQLGSELVSNNLFYNSLLAVLNNGGQKPKLYAPSTWSGGSSIAHLDETTYPKGNQNSLMSPQFAAREVIHDPGPITLNLFKDIGWTTTYINHAPLSNTENTASPAFNVIAIVSPDETPDYDIKPGEIKLHYYTSLNADIVTLPMSATGAPNEYTAQLPAPGGNSFDYFYYISVEDNLNRILTNPGKKNKPHEAPVQGFFNFHVGPDTEAPAITHTPKDYISFLETDVQLVAKIVERYNLTSVVVEYSFGGVSQPNLPMAIIDSLTKDDPLTGLTTRYYQVSVSTTSLTDGDEFAYKIVATDNSSNSNAGINPASDFHRIIFKGPKPVQNNYVNNFNLASDDFIGNASDFSIIQAAGFNDAAIHSVHPYSEASSKDLDSINYIYTLRVPIIVQNIGATIKFDEIVLIEPGEAGSVFGTPEFFDYVVVEASKDHGETWLPVADGYDSRDYSPWLAKYNSSTSGSISTAVGDPTLFRTRKLNLLNRFAAGDELLVRFRLFSDPGAAGWGWAIDNLRIQIDDEPPVFLHQHVDFIKGGVTSIVLPIEGTDNISIEKLTAEIGVNDQPVQISEEAINLNSVIAEYTIDIPGLTFGDKVIYKLTFSDESGNSSTLPASGYFEVPVIDFGNAVNLYSNTFNSASSDFVGNFFTIDQPSGFSDAAIHSSHNYMIGFGSDSVSNFTYTLTKPIIISASNPWIRFDEIVLVEGHAGGAVFGTPAFNDYVIVEGSKDGGQTWNSFLNGYDAIEQTAWLNAFNSKISGSPSLFRTRLIDMTENGSFASGDNVIIRFRLFSNESVNGWGWAIDNLYIQDAITSTEKELESALSVYPNPAKENIVVEAQGLASPEFTIQLMNAQGQTVYAGFDQAVNGKMTHVISAAALPKGMYFVKIANERNMVIRKVVKVD